MNIKANEPEPPPLRLHGCRRLLEWHGKIHSKSAPAPSRLEIWSVLCHDTKTYRKRSQYPRRCRIFGGHDGGYDADGYDENLSVDRTIISAPTQPPKQAPTSIAFSSFSSAARSR
jgi:hypothetical protein